ncbi:CoA transferase subunit A [Haloarcula japonica]|uniref:3-oxoadipate CoA-transferase n=1 Tax=Haloarcula japonica (strain ATCC 49778 / DSM 6131 / JCM 7785 / NBRC 101032 / NCIMB 13157 / TR-1) TaxID=1227453 RepID=M0L0J3_HALJT|nr:CoA-transferase [Haloarcula japonica]EMA27056.1 3-oxoadipate CoA-transferase [Haloarcula japonica DSM 6131]
MTKVTDMAEAVSSAIEDGQSIYLGGFTHLIPFAAGHEIIRQGYSDLTLVRATPDLIYDQMIAAGCASSVTFSWAGNPGVGSLRAFRRAIEDGVPTELDIDEYSHFGLVSRLAAGAQDLPFLPLRTFVGSDYPEHNDNIQFVENPFGDMPGEIPVVPPLNPDVAVVRGQRADTEGSAHLWGIVGEMVEAAFAADTVILSVEELVDTEVIRSDPNRTLIPQTVVDHVVEEPYGSHPSYAQGYYDRDNEAYLAWDRRTETHESTEEWLEEWVYGVDDRTEYLEKLEVERFLDLQPQTSYGTPVDMGEY